MGAKTKTFGSKPDVVLVSLERGGESCSTPREGSEEKGDALREKKISTKRELLPFT